MVVCVFTFKSLFAKLKLFFLNSVTVLGVIFPVFKSCPPCPMCMPKYAAILSLFGLKLSDYNHYIMPLMLISMLVSISTIGLQTYKKSLKLFPFICSFSSVCGILIFKYTFHIMWMTYISMFCFLIGTVLHHLSLNKWKGKQRSCSKRCCH